MQCSRALSKSIRMARKSNLQAVEKAATAERQDAALDKFLERKKGFVVDSPPKGPPIPKYPPFAAPPAPDARSQRDVPQLLWEDE